MSRICVGLTIEEKQQKWIELWDQWEVLVKKLIRKYISPDAPFDYLLQLARIESWDRFDYYDDKYSFGTYLGTVLPEVVRTIRKERCCTCFRKPDTIQEFQVDDEVFSIQIETRGSVHYVHDDAFELRVLNKIESEWILEFLETLTIRDRFIIEKISEGYFLKEIAQIVGLCERRISAIKDEIKFKALKWKSDNIIEGEISESSI